MMYKWYWTGQWGDVSWADDQKPFWPFMGIPSVGDMKAGRYDNTGSWQSCSNGWTETFVVFYPWLVPTGIMITF